MSKEEPIKIAEDYYSNINLLTTLRGYCQREAIRFKEAILEHGCRIFIPVISLDYRQSAEELTNMLAAMLDLMRSNRVTWKLVGIERAMVGLKRVNVVEFVAKKSSIPEQIAGLEANILELKKKIVEKEQEFRLKEGEHSELTKKFNVLYDYYTSQKTQNEHLERDLARVNSKVENLRKDRKELIKQYEQFLDLMEAQQPIVKTEVARPEATTTREFKQVVSKVVATSIKETKSEGKIGYKLTFEKRDQAYKLFWSGASIRKVAREIDLGPTQTWRLKEQWEKGPRKKYDSFEEWLKWKK
jgi:hypothetical protein